MNWSRRVKLWVSKAWWNLTGEFSSWALGLHRPLPNVYPTWLSLQHGHCLEAHSLIIFLCRWHGLQVDGHIIQYTLMLESVFTSTVNTTFIYWAKYHLTISCNKRNVPHITSLPGFHVEFMETSLTFQVAPGQRWALWPLLTPAPQTLCSVILCCCAANTIN